MAGQCAVGVWRRVMAAVLGMLLLAVPVQAQITFETDPIELSPASPSAMRVFGNKSSGAGTYRFRVVPTNPESAYEGFAEDFIISPPVATIPPAGSQTVRLLWRGNAAHLPTYFSLIAEPAQSFNAADGETIVGLGVSLPGFVVPAGAMANVGGRIVAFQAEGAVLELFNSGSRHAVINTVQADNGTTFQVHQTLYPNAAVQFLLAGVTGGGVRVSFGKTDQVYVGH